MGESCRTGFWYGNDADDSVPYQLSGTITPTRGRVDLPSVYRETGQASKQKASFQGKGEKVISTSGSHVV